MGPFVEFSTLRRTERLHGCLEIVVGQVNGTRRYAVGVAPVVDGWAKLPWLIHFGPFNRSAEALEHYLSLREALVSDLASCRIEAGRAQRLHGQIPHWQRKLLERNNG